MGLFELFGLGVALSLVAALVAVRRVETVRLSERRADRLNAIGRGSHRARLQVPQVDLARCLGCATCVRACPEEGVLALIHGQALVVHGSRCVGHGLCAEACPTGAIAVALEQLETRRDIPVLDENLEVPGNPGLVLGGEVTGFALIKTAIAHGTRVGDRAAALVRAAKGTGSGRVAERPLDLVIVGAGPAGLACSLRARELGLAFVTIEREDIGGTVARYPRRKLVMTQPVELPLHGRLGRSSYQKEELIELWSSVATRHELGIRTGVTFEGLEREADGVYRVRTSSGELRAPCVALMLGRRGTPRKLEVPGEELPKVAYALVDAQSYRGRRVLVVGGGDSAIEAALALGEQPGNEVHLSYRKNAFFRIKPRNEQRIEEAVAAGRVRLLLGSQVLRVEPEAVELQVEVDGTIERRRLPNDDVFVLVGGIPPFGLLERCGVSFDPSMRPPSEPAPEPGTGLPRAILWAAVFFVLTWTFALLHRDYYFLPGSARVVSPRHEWLRPGNGLGLAFGMAALGAMLANLAYLLRRRGLLPRRAGSLRAWMVAHLVTGIVALLLALLHSGLAPRHTLGGHALVGLLVLVVTGTLGRYFYSFVPRAANGRELELGEARAELSRIAAEWQRGDRELGLRMLEEIDGLVERRRWGRPFLARLLALLRAEMDRERWVERLVHESRAAGHSGEAIDAAITQARRAHQAALGAARYEELRGLLGTWRYLHRWIALLVVLLVCAHVAVALRYGGVL